VSVPAAIVTASDSGIGKATAVRYGITVNAVAPGAISTPTTRQEDVDPTEQQPDGMPPCGTMNHDIVTRRVPRT
jgi:NAD(P)-dependent dehydrogenase (short-subunit alcohol dehydrogenase family)